jgi:hypothetical protein
MSAEDNPTMSEADALLAKDLNELTIQERQVVLEEVHGVAEVLDETPAMIATSLAQLDIAIARIRKRSAYDRALFLAPKHVRNEKFRLMFLRADYFNAYKAAHRMICYFEYKQELWGDEKLGKTITLQDLEEEDIESLRAGAMHTAKVKDSSGRTILLVFQKHFEYKTWQNLVRNNGILGREHELSCSGYPTIMSLAAHTFLIVF